MKSTVQLDRSAPSTDAEATDDLEAAPLVRQPVAVVVSRFPKITETFILREIQELERQGQPVRLVPLLRHHDPVVHPDAKPWVPRALYTSFLSMQIFGENAQAFMESPGRYLRVLARVMIGSLRSPKLLRGTVGIFPKSVYLGRVLEREGVGHIHGHFATHPATAAYIASAFSGLPWSFTAHAHDIFLSGSRPMLGEKIRRASFVRVISDYNRRFLEERYPHAADGRIRVIHMGIDPDRYRAGKPDPGRIVCVASLRPYKGILSLVEACARTPLVEREFRLDLVGDGPQRREVEKRIRRLGLEDRVHLLGSRTQDEVAELLATAAIFVHPSTVTRQGWMDGIPVALMEAMATELPVVSTWVSGIPELIEDQREGILTFPDDPGALAEALAALLDDPGRRRAMGALGRKKVQDAFRVERCVASLIEILDATARPVPFEVAASVEPGLEMVSGGMAGEGTLGIQRMHVGRDSMVAELLAHGPEGRDELVVKVHREVEGASRSATERARIEFELLHRLYVPSVARDADPSVHRGTDTPFTEDWPSGAVPRPIALLAPEGTLVMERAGGRTLDIHLREWRDKGTPDQGDLLPALEATGRWLRWFQEQTTDPEGGSPGKAVEDLLQRAFEDLELSRPRLPPRLASTVSARLLDFAEGAVTVPTSTVGHHCDFWPGNVCVNGSRIVVIDFEGYRQGVAYEDVAYFLAHLELALVRPWHRNARIRARRAFLHGYRSGEDLDLALLDLCSTAKALQLLARTTGTTTVTAPARWWRRRILRRILERSTSLATDRLKVELAR